MYIMIDRCHLNLIYFTGIIHLTYDWPRCFFFFCYSNFYFFKLAYIYIFFFSLCCNRLSHLSGIRVCLFAFH